jgi:hypothetical protein
MRFQKKSRKSDMEKGLISALWSVNGIHSLLDVPKGTIYNSKFFYDAIAPDLPEYVRGYSRGRTVKGVLVHPDNIRPRDSKKSHECLTEFRARRVFHPAEGPDAVPNDFFLFETVKTEWQNYEIHSGQDLSLTIRAIFGEIPKDTLSSVSVSWI